MIEHRSDCPVAQGAPPEECTCLAVTPVQPARWEIPRNVWYVLISWGLAVVLLSGLFALWQWRDAHEAVKRDAEQDKALCEMITFSVRTPPTIPPGPAGDRIRDGLALAERLRQATCDEKAPR